MATGLHRLVIKPTLECTASCPTCALRLELYEKRKDGLVKSIAGEVVFVPLIGERGWDVNTK